MQLLVVYPFVLAALLPIIYCGTFSKDGSLMETIHAQRAVDNNSENASIICIRFRNCTVIADVRANGRVHKNIEEESAEQNVAVVSTSLQEGIDIAHTRQQIVNLPTYSSPRVHTYSVGYAADCQQIGSLCNYLDENARKSEGIGLSAARMALQLSDMAQRSSMNDYSRQYAVNTLIVNTDPPIRQQSPQLYSSNGAASVGGISNGNVNISKTGQNSTGAQRGNNIPKRRFGLGLIHRYGEVHRVDLTGNFQRCTAMCIGARAPRVNQWLDKRGRYLVTQYMHRYHPQEQFASDISSKTSDNSHTNRATPTEAHNNITSSANATTTTTSATTTTTTASSAEYVSADDGPRPDRQSFVPTKLATTGAGSIADGEAELAFPSDVIDCLNVTFHCLQENFRAASTAAGIDSCLSNSGNTTTSATTTTTTTTTTSAASATSAATTARISHSADSSSTSSSSDGMNTTSSNTLCNTDMVVRITVYDRSTSTTTGPFLVPSSVLALTPSSGSSNSNSDQFNSNHSTKSANSQHRYVGAANNDTGSSADTTDTAGNMRNGNHQQPRWLQWWKAVSRTQRLPVTTTRSAHAAATRAGISCNDEVKGSGSGAGVAFNSLLEEETVEVGNEDEDPHGAQQPHHTSSDRVFSSSPSSQKQQQQQRLSPRPVWKEIRSQ